MIGPASASEHSPAEPLSKARLRLWLKLLKTSRLIEEDIRRKLRAEYRSTLPRFDVMSALYRNGEGLRMSEISKSLRVSNGNITGIVDKLAAEGLAERVAVPGDRRANLVRLTRKGRDTFAEHAVAHEGWIDAAFGGLQRGKIAALSEELDGLYETLPGEVQE